LFIRASLEAGGVKATSTKEKTRMKIHANAPLGPKGRATMVRRVLEEGLALTEAAEAAGVSARTAGKWVGRYRAEGEAGLIDRSSAPRTVHNATPDDRVEAITALRRLRLTGPEIAELLEMATSTVSAVLKRIGLGKLSRLAPPEPPNRYERSRPGELIHIDVKKLGRIGPDGAGHRIVGRKQRRDKTKLDAAGVKRRQIGWECVHVCVDDATRLAYAEVLPDERTATVIGFLQRAVAFYRSHGVTVERLMTDNGSAYRSAAHSIACRGLGIRHLRTRPYRPQTNGKAERFIRTMLREWAYAAVYGSSPERAAALSGWIERYNFRRRHGALGQRPPIVRLRELTANNVAGIYT
jgi:transposase InsO family protein/transposase